ncbi:MAG: hypothetical protein HOJ16_05195 [Candidatus Peribacter sp.]|nr:hypothetical protein [Candidatus Peribacter sp.]
MSYKFTTGSVRSGDIRYEDDGDQTYIDFDDDKIALRANGVVLTLDDNQLAWTACKLEGAALHIDGANLYLDNNKGVLWGDSSVLVQGNATQETLKLKANATTYFHLDGDSSPGKIGIGTESPGSFLQISGSTAFNITPFSENVTLDSTHFTVVGDCNNDNVTFTLPVASDTIGGRVYVIKRVDSGGGGGLNTLTIERNGKTIDGMASNLEIGGDAGCYIIQCVNAASGWIILSKHVGGS